MQGLSDGAKAVGRGFFSGSNAAVQLGGGLVKGVAGIPFDAARVIAKYPVSLYDERLGRKMTTAVDRAHAAVKAPIDRATRFYSRANDAVQDYYAYNTPENPTLKYSFGAGEAASALLAPGIPGARALAMPVRSRTLARVLASKPVRYMAKSMEGNVANKLRQLGVKYNRYLSRSVPGKVLDATAQASVWGVPVSDYILGYSHNNPGTSSEVKGWKERALGAVPMTVGFLSPAAGYNMLYRDLPSMSSARQEALAQTGIDLIADNVRDNRGVLGILNQHREAANAYMKQNQEILDKRLPAMFDRPTWRGRLNSIRNILKDTNANKYLRWVGLQPSLATSGDSDMSEVLERNADRPRVRRSWLGVEPTFIIEQGKKVLGSRNIDAGKKFAENLWNKAKTVYNFDSFMRNPVYAARYYDKAVMNQRGYSPEQIQDVQELRNKQLSKWYPQGLGGRYVGPSYGHYYTFTPKSRISPR